MGGKRPTVRQIGVPGKIIHFFRIRSALLSAFMGDRAKPPNLSALDLTALTYMKRPLLTLVSTAALVAGAFCLAAAPAARAQTAYGVDATGNLYSFSVANAALTTSVGNIGFTPAGIDFNPANGLLYGIGVTSTTAQLYTISLSSGVSTPVGTGFALSGNVGGNDYDFTTATSFAFDFNPKTLQGDGSIRIRFVTNTGTDLRLNSATGGIAAVDGMINTTAGGVAPTIVGVAYSNNFAQTSGTTTLFDLDSAGDRLFTQSPPNNGTLINPQALGIDLPNIAGFDIYTEGDNTTNRAYAVANADPLNTGSEFYAIDLTTGNAALLNGQIGSGLNIVDIAVQPVPEPATYAFVGLGLGTLLFLARRRRTAARA